MTLVTMRHFATLSPKIHALPLDCRIRIVKIFQTVKGTRDAITVFAQVLKVLKSPSVLPQVLTGLEVALRNPPELWPMALSCVWPILKVENSGQEIAFAEAFISAPEIERPAFPSEEFDEILP